MRTQDRVTRRADGGWRRRIVLSDETVEKDDIVPATDSALAARAGTGLSQAQCRGQRTARTLCLAEAARKVAVIP